MTRPYLVSGLSFGAKGILAFLITYRLANSLSLGDFALWATMSSLGMVLSVSDFGIGQLVLTTLHEEDRDQAGLPALMSNAVAAMAIMSVAIFLLTSMLFAAEDLLPGIRWKYLIILVILVRLVFIPASAALQANERYHERKLIEALSYALGAAFVFWSTRVRSDVSVLLLGLNALITLGSVALWLRAHHLGLARVRRSLIRLDQIRRMFAESLPYFVNNVSGLVIYGGFIALSALVLNATTTARLSLLHSVVFMHLFQVFELIFRTAQTRMRDRQVMRRLRLLVGTAYLGGAVALALGGGWVLQRFFGKYAYSPVELVVYATFAFLEIYYLMLTSQMQMQSKMKRLLQSMSLLKTAGFMLLLIGAWAVGTSPSLRSYSLALLAFSLVMVTGLSKARWRRSTR